LRPTEPRLYGDLAWIWPIISPPEDYREESAFFAALLRRAGQGRIRRVLHLGCGGGSNDFTLKRYFQLTGVDLSAAMLAHARRLNPEVTYLEGDLRTVRLQETFDAVVCLDAVAYMLSERDLQAAFATAAAHLTPGGLFLTFIEETPRTFHQNRTVTSTHRAQGVEIAVIENIYDPDPNDTTFELTFVYLVRQGGRLTVHADRHRCGLFPKATWYSLLRRAGFSQIKEFRSARLTSPQGRQLPVLVARKG